MRLQKAAFSYSSYDFSQLVPIHEPPGENRADSHLQRPRDSALPPAGPAVGGRGSRVMTIIRIPETRLNRAINLAKEIHEFEKWQQSEELDGFPAIHVAYLLSREPKTPKQD